MQPRHWGSLRSNPSRSWQMQRSCGANIYGGSCWKNCVTWPDPTVGCPSRRCWQPWQLKVSTFCHQWQGEVSSFEPFSRVDAFEQLPPEEVSFGPCQVDLVNNCKPQTPTSLWSSAPSQPILKSIHWRVFWHSFAVGNQVVGFCWCYEPGSDHLRSILLQFFWKQGWHGFDESQLGI